MAGLSTIARARVLSVSVLVAMNLVLTPLSLAESPAELKIDASVLDFFPFGYRDKAGRVAGLSVDLFNAIGKTGGFVVKSHLLPVPRALSATTFGEVDILYSYRDEEMIKGVEFLGNVGCLTSLVVPRVGIAFNRLEDMNGRRIGFINAGYFAIRFAPEYDLVPFPLPSNETMLRMLVHGRLDGVVVNDAVLFAYLQRDPADARLPQNWQAAIGKPMILETLETHISISMKSPRFASRERIATAIEALRKSGEVAAAYRKYGLHHGGSCDPDVVAEALK